MRLYYSDQHVFPHSSFSSVTEDGKTNVILEHESTCAWIATQIRQHKPELVVNLGDSAHNFGNLDSLTLRCLYEGHLLISSACEFVGARYRQLLGNHDFENEAKRIHCFPFVSPIDLVNEILLEGTDLFVPFYRDVNDVSYRVGEILERNPEIKTAYIHLDYIGAAMNAYMVPSKKGVNPELFRGIRTFAGHYHHPQVHGDIVVVGSTGYRSFVDCVLDTPRGIVLDTGKKIKRIENPHTSIYFSAAIDDPKDIKEIPKYIDPARTYFRIKFPESANLDSIKRMTSQFRDVRLVSVPTPKSNSLPSEAPALGASPFDVITHYILSNPPEELPVEHVLGYAEDLLLPVLERVVSIKGRSVRIAGLKIRNFLSIGGVELVFDEVGVCYVDGRIEGMEEGDSNGAGKSSVFEALYWCLFNDLIREGSADDVVNSEFGCNCRVDTTFYIEDDEYIVSRMRADDEKGDYCCVFQNGEPIAEGLDASDQKILEILGCDSSIFKHTTFLVDTMQTRFSQLNQKQRVNLLESILMTEVYGELFEQCHDKLKAVNKRLDTLTAMETSSVATIETLNDTLKHFAIEQKQRLKERAEEEKLLHEHIADCSAQMTLYKKGLKVKQKSADKLAAQLSSTSLLVEQRNKDYDYWIKKTDNYIQLQNGREQELQDLEEKKSEADASGVCPYCGAKPAHKIDWSRIKHLKVLLKDGANTLAIYNTSLDGVRSAREEVRDKNKEIEKQLSVVRQDVFRIKTKLEELPRKIGSYELELATEIRESGTTDKVKKQIATAEEALTMNRQALFEVEGTIDVYKYLEDVFGPKGCRLWLLQEAVTTLNNLSIDNIEFLSRGKVRADLTVDAKGISMAVGRVLDSGELSKPKYGLGSGGERRKVDVGIQLGTSKLSSMYSGFRCNVMFLDEIDEKMDSASRQRLVELLEKLAVENHQSIYIASHHQDIRTMTTRTITMFNQDGVSSLLTEER